MNKIAAPRGTADILPPESTRWQAFESRAREIARRFGYGEIRTPMFEATELFVRGVGETTDIVEKEMYTFDDKGGRSMTLRPEWTAPVVRAAIQHNLLTAGPQRLYYIGPMFRYERPQAGRYRQAHQFGVECFGYDHPAADVEIIQMAHQLLAAHGITATLHLNTLGCDACRENFRSFLIEYFRNYEQHLSEDSRRRLERNPLRILDSKAPEDQAFIVGSALLEKNWLCSKCKEHFSEVCRLLEQFGIPYQHNPRIVRGLDYYTRTVFEFISDDLGAQSTVCAGGRYDGLVSSLGGPPTPAVGFALGIERFLMLLGTSPAQREGIALIALGKTAREHVLPWLASLRSTEKAPPVSIEYGDASLTSHFKKADNANAKAAVIVGDDELAKQTFILRNLTDRTQQTIAEDSTPQATAQRIIALYYELDAPAVLA